MPLLLAIDIGNTRIHFGLVRDGAVTDAASCPTAEAAGLERQVPDFLRRVRGAKPAAAAFISVRPAADGAVRGVVRRLTGLTPVKLGADRPIPVANRTDHPVQVGADRLVNAAAAFARARGPCIVAAFGTAITVDAVGADGAFLGGAILPGLGTQGRALHDYCEQLPAVEVGLADGAFPEEALPRRAIGKSTIEALRSGIIGGAAGAARRLVDEIRRELGAPAPLILTGGDAPLLREMLGEGEVAPHLTLEGIARAYGAAD